MTAIKANGSTFPDCRVCAAIRACWKSIFLVGIFSFGENILMLAVPLYMLQVYDRVLVSNSTETLLSLTVVTAFALLILSLFNIVRAQLLGSISVWLEKRLSPGLFERGMQSRLKGNAYGPESLDDLTTVRNFTTSGGMTALFDLPWTFVFIGVAYLLHPLFGHIAVVAAVILVIITIMGEWLARKSVDLANDFGMSVRRQAEASSRNAEVIEAMGMMRPVLDRWLGANDRKLELQAAALKWSNLFGSLSKFVRLVAQIGTLGTGAWLVLQLEATGGVMIAASIILGRALGPIELAIGSWRSIIAVRVALARLKAFAMEREYRPTVMSLPPPRGALTVEHVVYHLPELGIPPIIKGISFAIEEGESMAIIGPSGAGKTTLARILVGAIPPSDGTVRLDGADIFTWDRAEIGQYLGYLPQDIELFSGSVATNIARMGEPDSEAVVQAARMVGVHELVLKLPRGYDTEIGIGGQHLSGGQRQRIALARAVYGLPAVVVLDEPNSNLDGDGELALAETLRLLKEQGKTVILITHKMQLVQNVDKVLLMRDGLVEAFGPQQEVLGRLMGPQLVPGDQPSAPAGAAVPGD